MPEDNNTSNNSNQGVAWYIKPTSDTIDFLKGIPVNVLADPDNIKVFNNYVKIKSGGLNMVIPIVDAASGAIALGITWAKFLQALPHLKRFLPYSQKIKRTLFLCSLVTHLLLLEDLNTRLR